ncbi:MAG: helix-turn-helix transcriptional regulator [Caulobacter sp.]|nr:helix-turn-helix transcriptional regulator [Caulobacter sp.]
MKRTERGLAHPHPVDRHVGLAIRLRRRALRVSQAALGARVGVTFQQIQKYERGTNRVSASVLHGLARALACAPGDFFDGLDGAEEAAPARALLAEMLAAPGGMALAAAWLAIPPGPVRSRVTALVLAVGDAGGP